MNDPMDFDPSDERAEAAFREALGRDRDVAAALDTDAVRTRARRRSRMRVAGTALAVVVIAGGVATGVELGSGDSDRSTGPTSTLPAPDDDWRWDFYGDIRIQVPLGWSYGYEPTSDWCIDDGRWLPKDPYIDLARPDLAVAAIGCPSTNGDPGLSDEPPTDLWATHVRLSLLRDADQASIRQVDGWWIVEQPVGHVLVKAVGTDRSLVDRIVASATEVSDDSGGCSPHSPLQGPGFPRPQPAFDLAQLDGVDTITVCQYSRGDLAGPGLVAQYTMTGSDADAELQALQAAPIGGGPNSPDTCVDDYYGGSAIEVLLRTGDTVHTMYGFYGSCRGNGFDDGVSLRELTDNACIPLIHEPVAILGGSSAPFARCHPRDSVD